MHPIVFEAFETVLSQAGSKWESVLEIGTPKNSAESLLSIPILAQSKRTGIDLGGPYKIGEVDVLKGNATNLPFEDSKFDLVLCNSVLEHEPKFWLILTELKRVLSPGGLLMIGVPGFSSTRRLGSSTPTLVFHAFPDDFYRFSPSAVRDVFLEGLVNPRQLEVMTPPRIIGWGRKPQ